MDSFFQSRQVGDLALGKPAVRRLPTTSTVGEALKLLKKANEPHLGLWAHKSSESHKEHIAPAAADDSSSVSVNTLVVFGNGTTTTTTTTAFRKAAAVREKDLDPNDRSSSSCSSWQCVGRVSMIEIICFLARDESLLDLTAALKTPLSVFVSPTSSSAMHHVDSRTWLFEALDSFLGGVQHLVVPIDCSSSSNIASNVMLNSYHNSSIPNTIMSKLGATTTTTTSTMVPNINVQLPQSTHDGLRHFCINSASQNVVAAAAAIKSKSCEIYHEEHCWLAPEDVVRFLLSCIGLFSPIPMMSIQQLGLINTDLLIARATENAMSALPLIQQAVREMTAVAVIEELKDDDDDDNDGDTLNSDQELKLVGDISAFTMKGCNETAALALATLSVRDFLSYAQDCGGPPNSLVQLVRLRVQEKIDTCKKLSNQTMAVHTATNPTTYHHHHHHHHHHYYSSMAKDSQVPPPSTLSLAAALHCLETGGSEESSDEDQPAHSPDGPLAISSSSSGQTSLYKLQRGTFSKGRMAPNTCRPWSSLVAVMAQALTHRVGYIWVTDEQNCLLGIVTYLDIIKCLLNNLYESSSQ